MGTAGQTLPMEARLIPIAAALAPMAISFAVKMGVRLAATVAKAVSSGGPAAASSKVAQAGAADASGISTPTFAAALKEEEAKRPDPLATVATPTTPNASPLPIAQIAYQQGVRSMALGVQARAHVAWPDLASRHAYRSAAAVSHRSAMV